MTEPASKPAAISLAGEIVEIIESGGVASLRVVLHHMSVLDLEPRLVNELHLGDRIAIAGVLRVGAVRLTMEREARRPL
jgi:hypothetical protein